MSEKAAAKPKRVQKPRQRGEYCIWLSGAAVSVSLMLVGGLFLLIMLNGLSTFWPARIEQLTLKDGSARLGVLMDREENRAGSPESPNYRLQLKQGNRDIYGRDFIWIDEAEVVKREFPAAAVAVDRYEWGRFFGFVEGLKNGEQLLANDGPSTWLLLPRFLNEAEQTRARILTILKNDIGKVNARQEQIRIALKIHHSDGDSTVLEALRAEQQSLDGEYHRYEQQLDSLRAQQTIALEVRTIDNQRKLIPLAQIVSVTQPNTLNLFARLREYAGNVWGFIWDDPRESNTEGGVFPAIFGTVMVVFIMSFIVTPFGVLAAVYLREYAKQGRFVSIVRIAVNNLAGVPSIVFGVFGVGFFVYFLGGNIDQLFFADALPNPTFGTGGVIWASLTLALLTVPTVIVSAEEGLASIPRHLREGSYALGATKFETTWRVVLPALTPSILTGVILAVARAAGEVAPLMITGVVKLAPSLPIDASFPFLHLDRKFMHLGFHIYDVGFQSPNVEAARPMVYAATFLLLVLVVLLNLFAMILRNRLRQRYATSAV